MNTITNEQLIAFDVDNTLVTKIESRYLQVDLPNTVWIENPYTGGKDLFSIHMSHVQLIKEQHFRGRLVIVWSASGYRWSEAVVKALKLESYVEFACTKPVGYVDDKDIDTWIGSRIFVTEGER